MFKFWKHILIILVGVFWGVISLNFWWAIGVSQFPRNSLELLRYSFFLPIQINFLLSPIFGMEIGILFAGISSVYFLYFLVKILINLFKKIFALPIVFRILAILLVCIVLVGILGTLLFGKQKVQTKLEDKFELSAGQFEQITSEGDIVYYVARAIKEDNEIYDTKQEVNTIDHIQVLGAVDMVSKTELWSLRTPAGLTQAPIVKDQVYFLVEGVIFKIDKNSGEVIWDSDTELHLTSIPYFDDKNIYVSSFMAVASISQETGKLNWKTPTPEVVSTQGSTYGYNSKEIAVKDGKVFSLHSNGYMLVLDATTGEILWEKSAPPDSIKGGTISTTMAFIGNELFMTYRNTMTVLDPVSGTILREYTFDSGETAPYHSPVVYENIILLQDTSGKRTTGKFRAVDILTGKTIWEQDIKYSYTELTRPKVINNTVLVGKWRIDPLGDAQMYSFDLYTGEKKWEKFVDIAILYGTAIEEDKIYVTNGYKELFTVRTP